MPPLPEAIILVLSPFAPLFSRRVWRYAQLRWCVRVASTKRPPSIRGATPTPSTGSNAGYPGGLCRTGSAINARVPPPATPL